MLAIDNHYTDSKLTSQITLKTYTESDFYKTINSLEVFLSVNDFEIFRTYHYWTLVYIHGSETFQILPERILFLKIARKNFWTENTYRCSSFGEKFCQCYITLNFTQSLLAPGFALDSYLKFSKTTFFVRIQKECNY